MPTAIWASTGWKSGGDEVFFHGHCHQKALIGMGPSMAILKSAGCSARESGAGCCGMAGSFGYEAEHYEVSKKIGEERLFPAINHLNAEHHRGGGGGFLPPADRSFHRTRHQAHCRGAGQPDRPIPSLGAAADARTGSRGRADAGSQSACRSGRDRGAVGGVRSRGEPGCERWISLLHLDSP